MDTDEMNALGNALALQAIQEIGQPIFTISAELDVAHPSTVRNFKIFGDLLAKAYRQGFAAGQGHPGIDLSEVSEHEAARSHSEAEVPADDSDRPWLLSPVVELDDALAQKISDQIRPK